MQRTASWISCEFRVFVPSPAFTDAKDEGQNNASHLLHVKGPFQMEWAVLMKGEKAGGMCLPQEKVAVVPVKSSEAQHDFVSVLRDQKDPRKDPYIMLLSNEHNFIKTYCPGIAGSG